jgi:hypothetical protein
MFSIKSKRTEKPMQLSDYRRIENELQQQIKQATISHVPGESLSRKGWSTGCLGTNRNKTSEIVAYWFVLFMIIRYWYSYSVLIDDSDDEFHAFEPSSPEKIDAECMASNHHPPSTGPAS